MKDQTIDFSHSLKGVNNEETRPQDMVIQALEKFDVNFEEIRKEVNILSFKMSRHHEKDESSIFGENESLSYQILFVTYNIEFLLRLLTFQYDNKSEILKLDIQPKTTSSKKELEYCCNSLQRRRNLNLMFNTLITFARFIESRRLICDLILKKNRNIKIEQNLDGGIIIVYSDEVRNVKLGIFWSIACSSSHEITDVVEVYYKVVELPNKTEIINKLMMLTEPSLEFTSKYHLWKALIDDVSEKSLIVVIDKIHDTSVVKAVSSNCLKGKDKVDKGGTILCSDSEDPGEKSLVVMIDRMPDTTKETERVTLLSSDSEDIPKEVLVCTKNVCEPAQSSTVVKHNSDSQKFIYRQAERVALLTSDSDEPPEKSATDTEKPESLSQVSTITTNTLNSQKSNVTEAKTLIIDLLEIQPSTVITDTLTSKKTKEKEADALNLDLLEISPSTVVTDPLNSKKTTEKVIEVVMINLSDCDDVLEKIPKTIEKLENQSIISQASTTLNSQVSKDTPTKRVANLSEPNAKSQICNSSDSSDLEDPTENLPMSSKTTFKCQVSKQKKAGGRASDSDNQLNKSLTCAKQLGNIERMFIRASANMSENQYNVDDQSSGDEYRPKKRKIFFDTETDTSNSDSDSPKNLLAKKKRKAYLTKTAASLKQSRRSSRISSLQDTKEGPSLSLERSPKSGHLLKTPRRSSRFLPNSSSAKLPRSPKTGLVLTSDFSSDSDSDIQATNVQLTKQQQEYLDKFGPLLKKSQGSHQPSPLLGACQGRTHISNSSKELSISPNAGLVLISDLSCNSRVLNSLLPNKLLNVISSEQAATVSTPPKNVRIRLVPEVPVSNSPRFVELNLFTPKKAKIDDDLEITSVTYVVPE